MRGCHEGTRSSGDCVHGPRYQETNGWWYCADPRNPNPFGQVNDAGWCQCSEASGGCGRVFSGLSGFDRHQIKGRCATDAEMAERGLRRDRQGWWGEPA